MTEQPITTLAHQGGWDEALFVLVPMALVVLLMRMGAKRTPPDEDEDVAEGAGPDVPGDEGQQVT